MTQTQDNEVPSLASVKNSRSQILPAKQIWNFTRQILAAPEKCFAVLSLVFGLLFLFIIPPGQVPDEYFHFYRTYHVSEGNLLAQKPPPGSRYVGGLLPASLKSVENITFYIPFHPSVKFDRASLDSLLDTPLNPDKREFLGFPNMANYPPFPYFASAFAFNLGKLFNASPVVLLYLGRIGNLLVSTLIVFFAIKIVPFYKWLFLLLALTPMGINQRASLSADSFTNSISFLYIASILYYAYSDRGKAGLNRKTLGWLGLVSVLVTLSKVAYLPLVLLFFLIPVDRLGSLKRYLAVGAGLIFINLAAAVAWVLALNVTLGQYELVTPAPNVVMTEQLRFILSQPWHFIVMVGEFYNKMGGGMIEEFIGRLGWLDTVLPRHVVILIGVGLLFFALIDRAEHIKIGYIDKLKVFFILILAIFTLTAFVYMAWVPVGTNEIYGPQGRYFIPLGPLFLLLLYNRFLKIELSQLIRGAIAVGLVVISLSLTLSTLLERYYGG